MLPDYLTGALAGLSGGSAFGPPLPLHEHGPADEQDGRKEKLCDEKYDRGQKDSQALAFAVHECNRCREFYETQEQRERERTPDSDQHRQQHTPECRARCAVHEQSPEEHQAERQ